MRSNYSPLLSHAEVKARLDFVMWLHAERVWQGRKTESDACGTSLSSSPHATRKSAPRSRRCGPPPGCTWSGRWSRTRSSVSCSPPRQPSWRSAPKSSSATPS